MKEKIIKLLKSSNKQDIVLAFNMIEHWDKSELLELFSTFCMPGKSDSNYMYKTVCNYKGYKHFFLRTDCGLLLYADPRDGLGIMEMEAYGGLHKEYNLYE